MSPAAALTDLEKISPESGSRDASVRTQVALIRSLTDEIRRLTAINAGASALSEQLAEEMARLERMLRDRASEPPRA
jgi:hypothetical protein